MTKFSDNQATITYTKDPKYHSKIKCIDIKYNFTKDVVQKKEMTLKYISTYQMVVDPWTKPTPRDLYFSHNRIMRL